MCHSSFVIKMGRMYHIIGNVIQEATNQVSKTLFVDVDTLLDVFVSIQRHDVFTKIVSINDDRKK